MAASPRAPVHTLHIEHESRSALALLRRLLSELSTLFHQEFALATAELTQSIDMFRGAAVSLASGAVVLFAGFLVLLAGAVLGLATLLPPWLAALLVGVVVLALGFGLLRAASAKLQTQMRQLERSAERAVEALRCDEELILKGGP